MKQMMKYTFAIVTLLLVSLGAKADGKITVNGTVVYDVQGTSQNAYTSTEGTVSASIDNSRLVTLTITPAEGYFVMKDNITAVKTIDGNNAQTRTPGVSTPLDITGDDVVIGPTAKTYTFTMPDNAYDVEVTVDFLAIIDITNTSITLSETSYTYDGTEKKPSVSSVKLSGAELNATYYTIDYSNNTNAGTATVTVTGSGIYKNAATATFTIEKANLTTVTLAQTDLTYNGEEQTVGINSVKAGDLVVSDEWYEIDNSYPNKGTNVGDYTVKVNAKNVANNNFQGEATTTFEIKSKSIANATITLTQESFVYNGQDQKPDVIEVKDGQRALVLDQDYTITNDGGTNVGEYTVTIAGKGNYDSQTTTSKKFTITPKSIANVTISDIEDQTYTGNAIQPTVVVKDGENTLEKETDYTVSYSDNVNAALSTATEHAPTVIITGKGNYDSQTTAKKTFTIGKADPMLEFSPAETSITIGKESEFTKPKLTTTPEGLSVTYASMNTGIATVNVSTGDITPVAAGETEITATFAGNDNYNDGIAHYMLTVNPKTADLKYSAESVEITYGEEWTQPTLTNPDNLEITYASSNTQVATVSEAGV